MKLTAKELNSYILPGRIANVRDGLEEAKAVEALGLGGVFLSERWESKEIGSAMGALSQVTSDVKLVTGLTHFGTRHPLVLAGMGATMQTLSGGRFIMGFGRSVPAVFKRLGIPVMNNQAMADLVAIMKTLWAGGTVNYQGPAGDFPEMKLQRGCDTPPPIILGAIGPKTLALAGAHFDGVVLHPFLTCEGVARSVGIVHKAAEEAGRDPGEVKIYAAVVATLDTLNAAERADMLEARIISYLMHREVGSQIVAINGWDPAPFERLLQEGLSELDFAKGDRDGARAQLARAVDLVPAAWLTTGAAVGSPTECARRLGEYLDAGANELLFHGSTPAHQAQIVAAL